MRAEVESGENKKNALRERFHTALVSKLQNMCEPVLMTLKE